MALFLDPPKAVLSPNVLALSFITNFEGSFSFVNRTIGGFDVLEVTYHKSSNTFGANRIEAIANTLTDRIFLSQKGPNFVLPPPGNTKLKEVAATVLLDPVGQILVWDASDCDGAGYHVFDTNGDPIAQDIHLHVFHEMSHAYHNAIGTQFADKAAGEANAINETNLLRGELGLTEFRDPNNHKGGCGPGTKPPWWTNFLIEALGPVKVFLETVPQPPPGTPSPERIGELIETELAQTVGFSSADQRSGPTLRDDLERPVVQALDAFYRAASLVLDPDAPRAALLAELSGELARCSSDASRRAPAVATAADGSASAIAVFLAEPARIISEAHEAARTGHATVHEIAATFEASVREWFEKLDRCHTDRPDAHEPGYSELGANATLESRPPRGGDCEDQA